MPFTHIHYTVTPNVTNDRHDNYARTFGTLAEADAYSHPYPNATRETITETNEYPCHNEGCAGYLPMSEHYPERPCSGGCGKARGIHRTSIEQTWTCQGCKVKAEAATRKRPKTVYGTDEIPHLWMHQTQASAKNHGGNLFFDGETIFSYGRHFPIASHVSGKAKDSKAILLTNDTYSGTTSGRIHSVRLAIPRDGKVFNVHTVLLRWNRGHYDGHGNWITLTKPVLDHSDNLKDYRKRFDTAIRSAAKANGKRESYLADARDLIAEMADYAAFFGIAKRVAKVPTMPTDAALLAMRQKLQADQRKAAKEQREYEATLQAERDAKELERAKVWFADHADHAAAWDGTLASARTIKQAFDDAERIRQAEERAAKDLADIREWLGEHLADSEGWDGTLADGTRRKQAFDAREREAKQAANVAAWLAGEPISTHVLPFAPTLLRVVGDTVETSRGANFPLSHARLGYALVKRVMARGTAWHQNGEQCKLGFYRIDSISVDGTVRAGCHVVPFASIEAIASKLETGVSDGLQA